MPFCALPPLKFLFPDRQIPALHSFIGEKMQIINDEDGGVHKRYASPSLRDRVVQPSRASSHSSGTHVPGYGTSAIVAMDKSAAISSDSSFPSNNLRLSQSKTIGRSSERSLESVLSSSKEKVSAIESLLKGVSMSGQNFSAARSTSLDLGIL
jgi:CLIP-associating protein 1/2